MSEAVAETAAVEAAPEAAEATEESTVETVEEATEEVAPAEEVIYAGKYKSAEDLEKGYKEMQSLYNSRYKGFTGAPEDGEYIVEASEGIEQSDLEVIADTPMFQRLKERGIEQGMSNDMFNGIINDYISIQRENNEIVVANEKQKLGADADKRIENLIDRLSLQYEGERLEAVKSSLVSAELVEAWEDILTQDANTVAPADTDVSDHDTEAELNDLWGAVDERGRRKMEYDADYRNMVNKKFKAFYGE